MLHQCIGDTLMVTIHRKPISEEQLRQRRKDDKFKFIACKLPPNVLPTLTTRDSLEKYVPFFFL